MCSFGDTKIVVINGKEKLIDSCISHEIIELNKLGVITRGCCCGHGTHDPECLIDSSSVDLCMKLGYEVREYSQHHTSLGIYEILLKTRRIINSIEFENGSRIDVLKGGKAIRGNGSKIHILL